VRVNGFADIDGVCTHLYGQGHFTDHVTSMCSHHTATQNLAVAVGFR
jgi:hypothetical protein